MTDLDSDVAVLKTEQKHTTDDIKRIADGLAVYMEESRLYRSGAETRQTQRDKAVDLKFAELNNVDEKLVKAGLNEDGKAVLKLATAFYTVGGTKPAKLLTASIVSLVSMVLVVAVIEAADKISFWAKGLL